MCTRNLHSTTTPICCVFIFFIIFFNKNSIYELSNENNMNQIMDKSFNNNNHKSTKHASNDNSVSHNNNDDDYYGSVDTMKRQLTLYNTRKNTKICISQDKRYIYKWILRKNFNWNEVAVPLLVSAQVAIRTSNIQFNENHVILKYENKKHGDLWWNIDSIRYENRLLVLRELCDKIHQVHMAGYLHGDIKLENVLIDDDGRSLLLCDFETSRRIGESKKSSGGTYAYMSPTKLLNRSMTVEDDWWAFLVAVFAVYNNGDVPFDINGKKTNWDKRNIIDSQLMPSNIKMMLLYCLDHLFIDNCNYTTIRYFLDKSEEKNDNTV